MKKLLEAIVGLLSFNGETRGLDNVRLDDYPQAFDELRVILMKHGANCSGLHQLCDVCKFFRNIQGCLDSGEYEKEIYVDADAVQSAEDEIQRIKAEFPALKNDSEWVRKVRHVTKIMPQVLKKVCNQASVLETLHEMGVQPLSAETMFRRIPIFTPSHGWLEAEINTLHNSSEAAVEEVMTWGPHMWDLDKLENLMNTMNIPSIKHLQERQRQSSASKSSSSRGTDWYDAYPESMKSYQLVKALNAADEKVEEALAECEHLKARLESRGIPVKPHHATLSSVGARFGLAAQKPSALGL